MDDIKTKPAWLTTEFWLTSIPAILFIIKVMQGSDAGEFPLEAFAALAVGILTAGYAISRAITKKAALEAKTELTLNRTSLEFQEHRFALEQQHQERAMGLPNATQLERLYSIVNDLDIRLTELEHPEVQETGTETVETTPAEDYVLDSEGKASQVFLDGVWEAVPRNGDGSISRRTKPGKRALELGLQ